MITPAQLIEAAVGLVGTKYQHQGHSVHATDCIGIVFVAFEQHGENFADYLPLAPGEAPIEWNYGRRPTGKGLELLGRWFERIEAPVPGCLIFFQFPGEAFPNHYAIFDGVNLIHAHATRREVVRHGFRAQWVRDAHSYWKIPGVIYGAG